MNPRRLQRETSLSMTVASLAGIVTDTPTKRPRDRKSLGGGVSIESCAGSMRSGGRGRGLTPARGARGVEPARQAAALPRRGVLVDRPLGRDAVHDRGGLAQLLPGLRKVAGAQRAQEALHLTLEDILPGAVAGAPLEVL